MRLERKLPKGVPEKELEDYRVYRLTVTDIVKEGTKGAILCAVCAYTFYKSIYAVFILLPFGLIGFPLYMRKSLKEKRDWEISLHFKEAVWIMNGFMSAGASPENALIKTVPELKTLFPEKSVVIMEFENIAERLEMNIPMEKLLTDFALRSGIDDIKNFAEVFAIVKRNGGNMKEIVDKTTNVIRDKTAVAEEIKNLTASKRYEQNVMNIMPFAMIMYIDFSSGSYLDVMYESPAGRVIMTVCLILLCVSYILSGRILNIRI